MEGKRQVLAQYKKKFGTISAIKKKGNSLLLRIAESLSWRISKRGLNGHLSSIW
jgi:hypothetical protein